MRGRLADELGARATVAALGGLLLAVLVAQRWSGPGDLGGGGNDAAPALRALAGGDLLAFWERVPAMGPGSVIVRAPFVAVGGTDRLEDLALWGAVPCVWALCGLLLWLVLDRGLSRAGVWVDLLAVVALLTVAVELRYAVNGGHPEEALTVSALVGSVLLARADRPLLAGVLFGVAVACKPWAIVGLVAVLCAGARPWWVLGGAVGGLLLLFGPMVAVAAQEHAATAQVSAGGVPYASGLSLYFPLLPADPQTGRHMLPALVAQHGRLIVVLAATLVGLLIAAAHRFRMGDGALGLLAVVLLVRAVMDPLPAVYYVLPAMVCLLAWELRVRPGRPMLSLSASVLSLWVDRTPPGDLAALNARYLAAIATVCVLAVALSRTRHGRPRLASSARTGLPAGTVGRRLDR
ncbi:DUF2029 domain-containing protein [Conexibacter sp. W3-3-2]|uniref:glycosyltransferase 87 family protein n=1 Tax=Conexibacter sp. W3-3-2 TaxID=2675227 RepID=UPI0012B9DA65|nr:glycosyltransferase 87 family protein [Conexibacter sp. W3-3-2]MTD47365.1 DUF2029 domain-containing protein [Conexibacter sp. W3-3-2]